MFLSLRRYSYNGKPFNNKKKYWYLLQCEQGNHQAKWKNPDTEEHILHDSIYMKVPKKQIYK